MARLARKATKRRAPVKPVAPRPAPKPDTARKIHIVKCWPNAFESVALGLKTADLRHNDRGYQEGDDVVMREYVEGDGSAARFTGRELRVKITHVFYHETLQALGLVSDAAQRGRSDPEFREQAITAATQGAGKSHSHDDILIDRIADAMKWAQSRLPDGGGKRLILMSIKLYPDSLRSE